jgi:iron complex transport system ATP-binding protein
MYEAKSLTVTVRGRNLIEEIDLAIAPGRFVALVGPNGAGKSTLLRAMAGERKIAAGEALLHGYDVARLSADALAGWRAVLAQTVSISFPFLVEEVVRLGLRHGGNGGAAQLIQRALEAVQLAGEAARPINELSGGEQQRVHLARVLVQLWSQPEDGRARYLLLDEPTTHLDPAHQVMVATLAKAHAAAGGGVLAILHDLNLAAAVADEVAVMQQGRVLARGAPTLLHDEALMAGVYGVPFRLIKGRDGGVLLPHFPAPMVAESAPH